MRIAAGNVHVLRAAGLRAARRHVGVIRAAGASEAGAHAAVLRVRQRCIHVVISQSMCRLQPMSCWKAVHGINVD